MPLELFLIQYFIKTLTGYTIQRKKWRPTLESFVNLINDKNPGFHRPYGMDVFGWFSTNFNQFDLGIPL